MSCVHACARRACLVGSRRKHDIWYLPSYVLPRLAVPFHTCGFRYLSRCKGQENKSIFCNATNIMDSFWRLEELGTHWLRHVFAGVEATAGVSLGVQVKRMSVACSGTTLSWPSIGYCFPAVHQVDDIPPTGPYIELSKP